ncbi:MAG TPA: hypothetical protein VGD67_15785 [Pseudonocardiaceae bacterium]
MSAVTVGRVPGVVPASDLAVSGADGTTAEPRTVPVPGSLASLLPWGGLRRGSVVVVRGPTSLLFTLLSAASAAGSWVAVVGRPDLGVLAATEAGVVVERLVLVPRPGAELVTVAAALLDGVELVALAGTSRLSASEMRRLTGRARQRGAVLLPLDDWPGADVRLEGGDMTWDGVGSGHGRLRSMRVTVRATGRGAAARPRSAELMLVGEGSTAESVAPALTVVGPDRPSSESAAVLPPASSFPSPPSPGESAVPEPRAPGGLRSVR